MVFITEDTWRSNGVEVIIVDNIESLTLKNNCVVQPLKIQQDNIIQGLENKEKN